MCSSTSVPINFVLLPIPQTLRQPLNCSFAAFLMETDAWASLNVLWGNGGEESLGHPPDLGRGDEKLSWSNCVFCLGLAAAAGLLSWLT